MIVEKPPAETFLTKAALGPLSVAVTVCEPWLKPLNDTLSACARPQTEASAKAKREEASFLDMRALGQARRLQRAATFEWASPTANPVTKGSGPQR